MSSPPQAVALRQASNAQSLPYVYQSGQDVVVVFSVSTHASANRVQGQLVQRRFQSAGLARAVAKRVLMDLRAFGQPRRILEISEEYQLAAMRVARRRKHGRTYS